MMPRSVPTLSTKFFTRLPWMRGLACCAAAWPLLLVAAAGDAEGQVPGVPRDFEATADGDSVIVLSWKAPSSQGGSAITGYKIEVFDYVTNGYVTLVADTESPALTYRHGGFSRGTHFFYRISAINTSGAGSGARGPGITGGLANTPGPPQTLSARGLGSEERTAVSLSWTAPSDIGSSAITDYRITALNVVTGQWTVLTTTTAAVTTYRHENPQPGINRFLVAAVNGAGAGTPAYVAVRVGDFPDAPRSFDATAAGQTEINLSWRSVRGATGYRLYVSDTGVSGTWSVLVSNTSATSYDHKNLAAESTRHYAVRAIDPDGLGAGAYASATTDASGIRRPGKPTGLSAAPVSRTAIRLSWTAPTDPGDSPITGYRIEGSVDGVSWSARKSDTGSLATTSVDTVGIPNYNLYRFRFPGQCDGLNIRPPFC